MHVPTICAFFADAIPLAANAFDTALISWTDHFAQRSWLFDYVIYRISDNNLLKGGLFLTVLWGLWFRHAGDKSRDRSRVIAILTGCVIALAINKILQVAAPHRPRPYLAHLPGVTFPYDLGMVKISSFPSDHASLFFALSAGLWFFSRRLGLAATVYTIVVICLPRVYLGLHYPTDLLAGAVIGSGSACLAGCTRLREIVTRPAFAVLEKRPGLFYALFFCFTYQLATLFDDIRYLGSVLEFVLHHLRS